MAVAGRAGGLFVLDVGDAEVPPVDPVIGVTTVCGEPAAADAFAVAGCHGLFLGGCEPASCSAVVEDFAVGVGDEGADVSVDQPTDQLGIGRWVT